LSQDLNKDHGLIWIHHNPMYGALFSYIIVFYNSLWELHWNHKIPRILNSQFPKLKTFIPRSFQCCMELFNYPQFDIPRHSCAWDTQKECCTREGFQLTKFNCQLYYFFFLSYFKCGGMTNKSSKLQYTQGAQFLMF
jgi:hypothetical protein